VHREQSGHRTHARADWEGPVGLEGLEGLGRERPRPCRAEDMGIRGEASALVRAGGGAPAPLKKVELEGLGRLPFDKRNRPSIRITAA
jgi:hypothetical protein